MKQYFVQAMQGLNTDIPARRLPDHRLSDVSNVVFKDATVQKRWGISKMNTSQTLDGSVSRIFLYETAISGKKELLVFCEKEAYYYNNQTGEFEIITRCYSSGSAAASGTAVTGTTTYWYGGWDDSYNSLQIGFGSTNPNSITTWYDVSSIDSLTGITLSSSAGTIADGDYCLKFLFTGDEDDFFSVASPYDGKSLDKVVAVCNGIEEIMVYTGDGNTLKPISEQSAAYTSASADVAIDDGNAVFVGQSVYGPLVPASTVVISISGNTITMSNNATATGSDLIWFGDRRPAKYLGYFGSVGYEHFLSAWVAGTINEPQRIEVSAAGKYPEKFLNDVTGDFGTYYLLYDTNEEINGMQSLQNRIIVYKQNSITEMWAVPGGTNSDPYNFYQDKVRNIGPLSGETIVNYGRFHIFMGWDNFYLFDGINATPIGDEIIQDLVDSISETYANRAFAMPIREEKLYVVFVPTLEAELPNICYAYHYIEKTWTKWEFTDGNGDEINFTAWGRYRKSYSPTWASILSLGTQWDSALMRWTDLIIYDNIDRYLLGSNDGDIYEFAPEFSTDDGYGFVSSFTTKDFDLGSPKQTVKILEAILGMRAAQLASYRIRASVDFGNEWSEWRTVAITEIDEYIEKIANFQIRGKQVRFQVDNNVSSPPDFFEIENLNIGYNDSGIKR